MAARVPAAAWVSILAGVSAAVVSGVWLWVSWEGGIQFPPPLPDDLMEFDTLQFRVGVAGAFMMGVPVLTILAVGAGLGSRSHVAGRIGLLCGCGSALCYALFLRACAKAMGGRGM